MSLEKRRSDSAKIARARIEAGRPNSFEKKAKAAMLSMQSLINSLPDDSDKELYRKMVINLTWFIIVDAGTGNIKQPSKVARS